MNRDTAVRRMARELENNLEIDDEDLLKVARI